MPVFFTLENVTAFLYSFLAVRKFKEVICFDYDAQKHVTKERRNENEKQL